MEDLFRRIFDSAPDAALIVDSDGYIQMVNDKVTKLFGYEKDEIIGKSVETLMPEAYRAAHTFHRAEYTKNPHVRLMGSGLELISKRKDGSEFMAEISLSPFYFYHKLYVEACVRDVSEKDKLVKELKKRDEQVIEQNKRLINFAHIVSHNLRSYARNFKMMLLFHDQAKSEDDRKTIFNHLNTISAGLGETINHLNEIVTAQVAISNQKEQINLHHYVNKTAEVLSADINKKEVRLHNHVPPDIVFEYNPAYMESILLNLVSNAIKYSHPNRRPVIMLNAFYNRNHLILEITDNGLGIDLEKNGEKLFGLYKTFHGNSDAKGVGLFITKNQVEAMGGKIEVESSSGEGTTFRIFLS